MALIRIRRYVRRAQQCTVRHALEPLFLLARLLPKQVQMFVYECRGGEAGCSLLIYGPAAGALRRCLRRDRQDFLAQTAKKIG
eukprot:5094742-Pyramimonas_sp.AAC.1